MDRAPARREPATPSDSVPLHLLVARGMIGGLLMGLANLVPGISGGTMLLATGVYRRFIAAIAELTTLRFRLPSLVLLASIAGAATLAILLLAGPTKTLVVEHRWVMYSLFIGLTLGGVPLVWRLASPATPAVFGGAIVGFLIMLLMALAHPDSESGEGRAYVALLLSGAAGAGAMILPGVSGGYLLLLLGQYVPILAAIDRLKSGLVAISTALGEGSRSLVEIAGSPEFQAAWESLHVVIPVGVGVVCGVVGVSNLLQWLLHRFEKSTLGGLLGLLLGAVVGLWPFQQGVPPEPGERIRGQLVTAETAAEIAPDHWRVVYFEPRSSQAVGALALLALGLAATLAVAHIGEPGEPGGPQGRDAQPSDSS